ncbi:unnamed protein product [Triticum turgidum subsp. durum]|uniref:Bidirectional sugar transporter SWEET n=1 Tax=Triticum turgidum subsp. durum TaxID=4567 RepID=A0A9R0YB90_TRITD|nr:unnamed protein product [Triticum turgidum subsp. durum]
MLWIFYALVKTGEGLLITINAAGCVIETIYIVMYLVYAPRKAKIFTAKIVLLLNIAGFGLIFLLTVFAFQGETRVISLGWICVGFSVCVFVAPLSIIVSSRPRVWSTCPSPSPSRSPSAPSSGSSTACSSRTNTLPNILGFTFGMIQMVLYMFYMNATPVVTSDVKEVKEAWKVPAEDQVVVINVGKADKSSCAEVRPVTEMASAVDVPRRCAAEAAAPRQQVMAVDFARSVEVV